MRFHIEFGIRCSKRTTHQDQQLSRPSPAQPTTHTHSASSSAGGSRRSIFRSNKA